MKKVNLLIFFMMLVLILPTISLGATCTNGCTETINLTAGSGYTITDVKVNGTSKGAINSWGFTDVGHRENCTRIFNISVETGYILQDVKVNGVSQGAITSYTCDDITKLRTLEVITQSGDYSINTSPTGYAITLNAAIGKCATSGNTISLKANITDNTKATIPSGKTVTLDLKGKTITTTANPFITVNGTLNIIDSVGGGKITSSTGSMKLINVANGGKVTINGGTLNATGSSSYGVYGVAGSTITLGSNDGSINKSNPSISGKSYGILSGGTVNYYDGVVKGGTQAIHANITPASGMLAGEVRAESGGEPTYVTSGLGRYFDASQNSGWNKYNSSTTLFADLSGHFNGTVKGNPVWNGDKLTSDGSGDWVNVGAYNPSKVTVEAVFELSSLPAKEQNIVGNVQGGGYALQIADDKKLKLSVNIGGSYYTPTFSTALQTGRKYHVVGTYDGSNAKLYVDNVLVDTVAKSGTIKTTGNSTVLAIGANPNGTATDNYLYGSFYMVRVYNRALTAAEVTQNYTSAVTGPDRTAVSVSNIAESTLVSTHATANLTKYYNVRENDGVEQYNSSRTDSVQDLAGTTNGTISEAILEGNKLSFDGTNDWVNLGITNYAKPTLEAIFTVDALKTEAQHIISNAQSGGYILRVNEGGGISFGLYSSSAWRWAEGTEILEPGKKYHAVGTYDGTTICVYLNGKLVGSTAYTGTITNAGSSTVLALGTNPKGSAGADEYLAGDIYMARVYNGALTAAQVKQNYEASMVVKHQSEVHTGATLANGGICSTCGAKYIKVQEVINHGTDTIKGYYRGVVETYAADMASNSTMTLTDLLSKEIGTLEIITSAPMDVSGGLTVNPSNAVFHSISSKFDGATVFTDNTTDVIKYEDGVIKGVYGGIAKVNFSVGDYLYSPTIYVYNGTFDETGDWYIYYIKDNGSWSYAYTASGYYTFKIILSLNHPYSQSRYRIFGLMGGNTFDKNSRNYYVGYEATMSTNRYFDSGNVYLYTPLVRTHT